MTVNSAAFFNESKLITNVRNKLKIIWLLISGNIGLDLILRNHKFNQKQKKQLNNKSI